MKKTSIRLLAVLMAALLLCGALASCSSNKKPSGVYENETFGLVTTYTFEGDRYTVKMIGLTQYDSGSLETGTFEIDGKNIIFTSDTGLVKTMEYSLEGNVLTIGTLTFEKK